MVLNSPTVVGRVEGGTLGVMQSLPSSVLRLWRITALAAGAAVLIGGGIALLGLRTLELSVRWVWLLPLLVGAAVTVFLLGALMSELQFRAWSFDLGPNAVEAKWGVLTKRHAIVPRNRVQTITTEDGPLDRFLNLTTLTVHTAGAQSPNLRIPHLDRSTVAWIRDELASGGQRAEH